MRQPAAAPRKAVDRLLWPLISLAHALGLSPSQVTWLSLAVCLVAAALIAAGRLGAGLVSMAVAQVLDGVDGGLARVHDLASEAGQRLDTITDRVGETAVFLAFAYIGLVPLRLVLLAVMAIMLLTTVSHRSGFDPGVKRFALYFGLFLPWPILFWTIFGVNLVGYVVGLLILDFMFQKRMDRLGGDLDTVASRAAVLERNERS